MKTSACSIPASSRPSSSSAVLTVKRPPASSHVTDLVLVETLVGQRIAVEHRNLMPGVERQLGHEPNRRGLIR